jgi:hypothetical protein
MIIVIVVTIMVTYLTYGALSESAIHRAKFAKEAAGGDEAAVSGRWKNTLAKVGVYAGKKALFEIGVAKTAHFGGDNLTEEQRRTMRYEITMSFRLRDDVDPASLMP